MQLFERDVRGMTPTAYALSLKGYAQAACVAIDQAERQVRAMRSGDDGEIAIAAPPLIMTSIVPPAIVRVTEERPMLRVRLVSRPRGLFEDLLEGRVDLVVSMLFDEIPGQGLEKHHLFDDRLVLVMRPGHPLIRRRKVTPQELHAQKWIFAREGNWGQSRLRTYFEQEGLALPLSRIQSHDHLVMKSIIMASDYIGLIAKLGVKQELESGALKCVDLQSAFSIWQPV